MKDEEHDNMAKKVIIVDDIDGNEGDGVDTYRFSLGSDVYEIDLCPQNLLTLRAALEPFVSAGRRVRSGNRHKPEPAPHQQDNSASDFPSQQPLTAVPHQQDNPASDFPSQQPLTAVPRQQDNPALDFPSQQPLTAVPRQQGNPALDFPREQRLVIRKWARDNGYDVGDRGAFSREVLAAYREAAEEDEQAQ